MPIIRSDPGYIVRNLTMRNSWPSRPIRTWRKSAGPFDVIRTNAAMTRSTGLNSDQEHDPEQAVERLLDDPARSAQRGVVDVQHRQAVDRADRGTAAGDVHQRARDDQVDLVVLDAPADPAQRRPVDLRAGQHDHRVGLGRAAAAWLTDSNDP